MKCSKCGTENQSGKFCQECGELLEEQREEGKNERENERENERTEEGKEELKKGKRKNEKAAKNHKEDNKEKAAGKEAKEADENIPQSQDEEQSEDDVREALYNLEKYEQGTITDPKDKPKDKKKSFLYPQNPMLWSFLWLLFFGVILGALSAIFFGTDLEGKETVFGIIFAIFAAAVLGIDFIYYFPAALQLDRLLKGKGVRLEYRLKNYELIEIAEKAKKRNRGFYLAIGLFGLAFTIYYIYILATTVQQTTLMWISLIFSTGVFIICAALFFVMPKFNYGKTMENGSRVIAVGTTSCRTLESAASSDKNGEIKAVSDDTGIFIYPGYEFKAIDGLITNFHLPESTLIMLVSAFLGRERTLAAYREAIDRKYRFFSFGDAMLIV